MKATRYPFRWLVPVFAGLIVITLFQISTFAQTKQAKKPTQARTVKQYTIEQFLNTISIGGSSFSSDEKSILVHSNKSGIYNVYAIPLAGGEMKQVTNSTESTFSLGYFPNDSRILYTHDQGGNENNHIYMLGADGKEKDLTPGDKLKAQFHGWSQDGKGVLLLDQRARCAFLRHLQDGCDNPRAQTDLSRHCGLCIWGYLQRREVHRIRKTEHNL